MMCAGALLSACESSDDAAADAGAGGTGGAGGQIVGGSGGTGGAGGQIVGGSGGSGGAGGAGGQIVGGSGGSGGAGGAGGQIIGGSGGAGGAGGQIIGGAGGEGGQGGSGGQGVIDEYGFELRVPPTVTVPCEGFDCNGPTADLPAIDYVCTFVVEDYVAAAYFQFDPLLSGEFYPEYQPVGAWLSVDNALSEITATYDYGGRHHNDEITAQIDGLTWRFAHSSYGFGFRVCQPMDCLQQVDAGAVVQDGCTVDRTLPIVCAPVEADGTHPPLSDTFAPCNGDPNYP